MEKKKNQRRHAVKRTLLQRQKNFTYKLILEGIGVGLFAGLLVSLFRWVLGEVDGWRNWVLDLASQSMLNTVAALAGLAVIIAIVFFILKKEPLCSGSGIPQVKGELRGEINANWLRVIVSKLIGGVLAIGAGLSLGREGPSIQLGAMAGKGFSRLGNRLRTEEKILMTCGAGAGLAAAFSAPLAGVLFTLEELYKNFSTDILLCTMAAAVTADWVAAYLFGLDPVFRIDVTGMTMPLSHFWLVILLGVILGAFGVFYNKGIAWSQDFYAKLKPHWLKAAIPYACIVVLAVLYPTALGSGHHLVEEAGEGLFDAKTLLVLLAIKFVFSLLSFGTGAPGGIFLPLLVLGAVTGSAFIEIMGPLVGYTGEHAALFIVLGMAGYFAAIVRAPITGVILISEMTGSFNNFLSLALISFIAYVTAELLGGIPIYDQLLERMLYKGNRFKKPKKTNKVLIESQVAFSSAMDGKLLFNLRLPEGCLVVSVEREGQEIVPNGRTRLLGGDKLTLLCSEGQVAELEELLERSCQQMIQ